MLFDTKNRALQELTEEQLTQVTGGVANPWGPWHPHPWWHHRRQWWHGGWGNHHWGGWGNHHWGGW